MKLFYNIAKRRRAVYGKQNEAIDNVNEHRRGQKKPEASWRTGHLARVMCSAVISRPQNTARESILITGAFTGVEWRIHEAMASGEAIAISVARNGNIKWSWQRI